MGPWNGETSAVLCQDMESETCASVYSAWVVYVFTTVYLLCPPLGVSGDYKVNRCQ